MVQTHLGYGLVRRLRQNRCQTSPISVRKSEETVRGDGFAPEKTANYEIEVSVMDVLSPENTKTAKDVKYGVFLLKNLVFA